MSLKSIFIAAAMAIISITVFADDNARQASFTVNPPMSCANCEKKIKSNLRFEKGVKTVETSIPEQKVNITYNPSKTSEEKLIEAFRKIGYKAVVIQPDAKSGDKAVAK